MRLILIFFLTCTYVEPLFAWGAEGHRAIGALAQELISSETRLKVQQLLDESGDQDLASASTWADEVRENARLNHPRPWDAEAFNRQFPNNTSWHFVNLPLGTISMTEAEPFVSGKNDVIHAIERCITFLETGAPGSGELSRPQAFRLLVHLVGDIHQPLHCGTGFYRLSDTKAPALVMDPSEALGLPNDRGGNDLFYGPKGELHALWDIGLVAEIADTFDFRSLEAVLRQDYFRPSSPVTPGDYHRWPEVWALESVKLAKEAYFGIRFNTVETMGERDPLWISITLPADYEKKNKALAAQQLVRAGVRLAQLLDRLRWP
jgi:hypothetical protein